MAESSSRESRPESSLRLWPGVVAAGLLVLVRLAVPVVFPDYTIFGVLGAILLAAVILVWWTFFSRAPWSERLVAIALMIVAMAAGPRLVHPSIQNGMMGMMFFISAPPTLALALVAWAVASRRLSMPARRLALVGAVVTGTFVWTLVRTDGITGGGDSQLKWRWSETAEERLLAQARAEPASIPFAAATTPTLSQPQGAPVADVAPPAKENLAERAMPVGPDKPKLAASAIAADESPAEWPGFRGPERDGVTHGPKIKTDWAAQPPVELWRRSVGPGWSSFAVRGDRFFTQEQRGEDELVVCYELSTGRPVWMHRDSTRFWESNGGAGPRATPLLSHGRVYTLGATGVLNALNAEDGAVVWSRNAAKDAESVIPGWGFSGSPIVVGNLVIVHAGRLVAYDLATGDKRWIGPKKGGSYSSPQLLSIGGETQIVQMNGSGAISVAPSDGALLWEHAWPGAPIVQPTAIADGILVSTSGDMGALGTRRLKLAQAAGKWTVEERWTSPGLKPYFNDLVVHKGHAYGFDGFILACVDLQDGRRLWKGGRYGYGQILLMPDQDLLLVLSEKGELALVSARPDEFKELARIKAIEGKTWNHPVLVGDVLLVRNGEEMAAFRLAIGS